MPRDHTVLYDPHSWATSSGFPVAVLDGQQAHFIMRRIQDKAVRLMYELPHGTVILTAPLVGGRALQLTTHAP